MSPIRNVIEQNSGRARRPLLPWHRLAKRMQSKPVVLPLVWNTPITQTQATRILGWKLEPGKYSSLLRRAYQQIFE
jgi:hypothetical protein